MPYLVAKAHDNKTVTIGLHRILNTVSHDRLSVDPSRRLPPTDRPSVPTEETPPLGAPQSVMPPGDTDLFAVERLIAHRRTPTG